MRSASRALFLKLDDAAKTATVTRARSTSPTRCSRARRATSRRSTTREHLVGWGSQGYFTQFAPDGTTIFDARIARGQDTYRAYRFPWVGTPAAQPSVASTSAGRTSTRAGTARRRSRAGRCWPARRRSRWHRRRSAPRTASRPASARTGPRSWPCRRWTPRRGARDVEGDQHRLMSRDGLRGLAASADADRFLQRHVGADRGGEPVAREPPRPQGVGEPAHRLARVRGRPDPALRLAVLAVQLEDAAAEDRRAVAAGDGELEPAGPDGPAGLHAHRHAGPAAQARAADRVQRDAREPRRLVRREHGERVEEMQREVAEARRPRPAPGPPSTPPGRRTSLRARRRA